MASYATIQAEFYDFSSKASQAVRVSAVSGVGAVWIISQTPLELKTILLGATRQLEISAFLFILALALDLLHSFVTSIVYWYWLNSIDNKYRENLEERDTTDIPYTNLVRRTPWVFYFLKAISILTATGYLLFGVYSVL